MQSDDLFNSPKDPQVQWDGLEKRINRLLEGVVQLRSANAQLMKENVILKKQLKDGPESSNGSSEEVQKLRQQYEQAMKDLTQVKQNLQKMESLAAELKLEDH